MYEIQREFWFFGKKRLVSCGVLNHADFQNIAHDLNRPPLEAKKTALVAAVQVETLTEVITYWNGKETTNEAQVGDWIVTTLDASEEPLRDNAGNKNRYIVEQAKFPCLYLDTGRVGENGRVFESRGAVKALFFEGGFEIEAPWGEKQSADSGYLLLNGEEVYGNAKETFESTYRLVGI